MKWQGLRQHPFGGVIRDNICYFWENVIFVIPIQSLFIYASIVYPRSFRIPTYQCKNPKVCDPILVTIFKIHPYYSQSSRENATPCSGTPPLAFYKKLRYRRLRDCVLTSLFFTKRFGAKIRIVSCVTQLLLQWRVTYRYQHNVTVSLRWFMSMWSVKALPPPLEIGLYTIKMAVILLR